jgi:hypothetical protein
MLYLCCISLANGIELREFNRISYLVSKVKQEGHA